LCRVAGVDEAGRGPLAGPVFAGAVVFDESFVRREEHGILDGLTDSKKLSETRRDSFCRILQSSSSVHVGLGSADVREIDEINILRATHRAMMRAIQNLRIMPDHILVDGLPVPGFPCPSTAIIGGDFRSLSIAAASVIAKVARDCHMRELGALYPEYGFARHKGYASVAHVQALLEYGPCPVHRQSFRPVREAGEIHARSKAAFGGNGAQ
jgi:ribonuclease HII